MHKHSELSFLHMIVPLLAVVFGVVFYLQHSGRAHDRQFASYPKEIAAASFVAQTPAAAIPARDRPIIALMRQGKRVTNAQVSRLWSDIYPHSRARRKAMLAWSQRHYIARQKRALMRLLRAAPHRGVHAS
jgi:hypothetical protein